MLVDSGHCNTKTIVLESGGLLTLDCSNIFAMHPSDREFALALLLKLEEYAIGLAKNQAVNAEKRGGTA